MWDASLQDFSWVRTTVQSVSAKLTSLLGAGLKSLEIIGTSRGLPRLPTNTTLELKNLCLNAEFPPSTEFPITLFEAAPSLTRIQLTFTSHIPRFPADFDSPFQSLAVRLYHLKIAGFTAEDWPWPWTRGESFNVADFLTACTSLKTLELGWMRAQTILQLLESLNAHLDVLATQVLFEDDFRAAELIAALELPALRSWKRWRG